MTDQTILIVDDEADTRALFARMLNKNYNVLLAESVEEASATLKTSSVDLVLTDLVMPKQDGLALVNIVQQDYPTVPVIVISGNATFAKVVEAIKMGAADFIEKPVDSDILLMKISKALEFSETKQEVKRLKNLFIQDFDTSSVVAKSPEIERVLKRIQKVAHLDATVLLTGETGVGKDLFARLIVANSERKHKKFVAVNCGSIPETLLESMLFGHKKGAFTSAIRDQIGYFEEANGGTIFLDEISETSLTFQTKLLRVIEDKTIRKVGDIIDIPLNIRILTATNKDLKEEIKEGTFRKDLYYRLNVIEIHIPPLRERLDDIEALALHFMEGYAQEYKKPLKGIARETMDILLKQYWKGNVRELKHAIEYAVIMTTHDILLPADLPAQLFTDTETGEEAATGYLDLDYANAKAVFEKRFIDHLLTKTNGDVFKASRLSNMTRQNLHKKINRYHFDTGFYRARKGS